MGSLSKRSDGTWEAKISLGLGADGKRKRKSFYGKTRKEAYDKMIAAQNDMNSGAYIEPSKMTVAQWLDTWRIEYKKRTLKPSSYYDICTKTERHIKPYLGTYRIMELRGDMIQNFVNTLSDSGLASSTVRKIYVHLHEALKQAVAIDLIPKNPAVGIKITETAKKEIRILSIEEQANFIYAAKDEKYGEIFIVALATGMRIGELLSLQWSDIDFKEHVLQISKSVYWNKDYFNKEFKGGMEIGTPKTKSSIRMIPLLPPIIELLKNIQEKQAYTKQLLGGDYNNNNLVFCNFQGGIIWNGNIRRAFHNIEKKIGISGLHTHCLRHTFASRGLENGIELREWN